jgi:hypothetical protein
MDDLYDWNVEASLILFERSQRYISGRDRMKKKNSYDKSLPLEHRVKEIIDKYPLNDEEKRVFLQSNKRVDKIIGIEKYKNSRMVFMVINSDACIAGHKLGDKIYFDSMGRLLVSEGDKPVCARLINKIWYRLIMLMDRMADASQDDIGNGNFSGQLIDVAIACYGAVFPSGDCGQVIVSASMELDKPV